MYNSPNSADFISLTDTSHIVDPFVIHSTIYIDVSGNILGQLEQSSQG
jgi:hypothetical protein